MDFSRYTKFFNYGYFLSKFEPKFLKKLLSATEDSEDITEPLKAGKSQHHREKTLCKLKSISKTYDNPKSKSRDIEREW